ncbi:MAG: hypothetical protein HYZ53_27110 [Planctomycetes bacterium]|nr:hypothetical protein [Planctomycetota bacterium]
MEHIAPPVVEPEPEPAARLRLWYSAPAAAPRLASTLDERGYPPEPAHAEHALAVDAEVLAILPEVLDAWVAALETPRLAPVPSPVPEVRAPELGSPLPPAEDAVPAADWWADAAAAVEPAPGPDPRPTLLAIPATEGEILEATWWSDAVAAFAEDVAPDPVPDRLGRAPAIDPEALPSRGWWWDAVPELECATDATVAPPPEGGTASRRPLFASASQFVRTAPEYEALVKFLLGRYAVADDLEKALAARDTGAFPEPIVTLSGELVEADGALSGGPAEGGISILSRKAELRELEKELESVRAELAETEVSRVTTVGELDELATRDKSLQDAIYVRSRDLTDNEKELSSRAKRKAWLARETEVNRLELVQLGGQLEDFAKKADAIRRLIADLEAYEQDLTHEIEDLTSNLRSAQSEKETLGQQVADLKARTLQFGERKASHETTLSSLGHEIAQTEEAVRSTEGILAANEERIAKTSANIEAKEAELARLEAEASGLRSRLLEAASARDGAQRDADARKGAQREAESRISALDGESHEVEKEEVAYQARLENLVGRVRDELGVDLVALLASTPEDPDLNWEELTQTLEELKRRLDSIGGGVNLAAIEELKEAEERFQFLTGQQKDLESSKAALEDLMRKLNRECREKFEETLEKIRENFAMLFRKLFGGGKADIILEQVEAAPAADPMAAAAAPGSPAAPAPAAPDILESGIEILAKPPGKEPTSISLLSGGEKALTTLALVMGIFLLKPSPFCIMDEVDAPLDESNIDRFTALVKEFVSKTQFLVITHNKKSMAASGVIYGVTQEHKGVSKKISVKLVDEAQAVPA